MVINDAYENSDIKYRSFVESEFQILYYGMW